MWSFDVMQGRGTAVSIHVLHDWCRMWRQCHHAPMLKACLCKACAGRHVPWRCQRQKHGKCGVDAVRQGRTCTRRVQMAACPPMAAECRGVDPEADL